MATPPLPGPGSPLWKLWGGFTAAHIAVFRATNGRVGGRLGKAGMLLLNHVGRRSGKARTSPLLYIEDGDDLVVVASKGGSRGHPAWWLNLREMDEAVVEIPGEKRTVRPHQATPEERARLWPLVVDVYGPYSDYQARTEREIPVVLLSPLAARAGERTS